MSEIDTYTGELKGAMRPDAWNFKHFIENRNNDISEWIYSLQVFDVTLWGRVTWRVAEYTVKADTVRRKRRAARMIKEGLQK